MTSLVAWIGVDSRGPASLYLASDSRISWTGLAGGWDSARKLFAASRSPEIFGFAGVALFPSQVLSQTVDLIDAGLLVPSSDEPQAKFKVVSEFIRQAYSSFPTSEQRDFTIVYGVRHNHGMSSRFAVFELKWTSGEGWKTDEKKLPESSGIVPSGIYGSGKASIKKALYDWRQTEAGGTSRAIFSAFCDSLSSGKDRATGGAPQLVCMYRKEPAKLLGVIYRGRRYLCGVDMGSFSNLDRVEWRNDLFERCDAATMKRLENAQPQARPRNLM